ncbi:DNA-processing protein DprA [Desulfovibrio sp. OttesenSCG-928-A18]|nr:DNA-processing protein DprA [Desulfovibrio sp. OttesenSCG-928-A18]
MTRFSQLDPVARQELWAMLALRHAQGLGARRAKRLLEHYGTALAAAEAGLESAEAWPRGKLVPRPVAAAFAAGRWRPKARAEWDALRRRPVSLLYWGQDLYPDLLREIPDPPLLLYYQGDISLLHGPAVAVVGARDCTREGIAVAAFFARDLSNAGVTVISGMARGIDRAAHLAGLEGPGSSVAVLGTGIDVLYPRCNADVYRELGGRGLLLSEFAPGVQASGAHFPIRNRLISGLSRGVLVVEAAGRSGSLITARLALEQDRDVFAVPGHTMAAVSEGCRELIRRGAKAVFRADDILLELAPLLSHEAAQSLRQRSEQQRSGRQARRRAEDPFTEALENALSVLPEGGLPWIAQPEKAPRRASARSSSAASAQAPSSGAGGRGGRLQGGAQAAQSSDALSASSGKGREAARVPLSADESRVLAFLSAERRHMDALSRALDMDVGVLSALLATMEVRGLVRQLPGMFYALPEES